jgi:DNA adenine methylase
MKLGTIRSNLMAATAKPFLKWAGAKTQLIKTLRRFLPADQERRFIEPFVGSGVVFLNTHYRSSLLSDSNHDLVTLYSILKSKRSEFINRCQRLFTAENNSEEKYYELREEFNASPSGARRASLFVYLNRHCFNGLCRYNKKGAFNTPFGTYGRVYFPAEEMAAFAEKLQHAGLQELDFREALASAREGDVVYCDPPYVPLTPTASFTNYAAGGFSEKDQKDLHRLAVEASGRGAVVVLSNHDTAFTQKLYCDAAHIETLMVSRTISCDGQNRNKAKELIAVFGEVACSELRF